MKFDGIYGFTSGQQRFINAIEANAGDTVKAEITMLWLKPFLNSLFIGMNFGFYEGSILIGTGFITEILNKSLERL